MMAMPQSHRHAALDGILFAEDFDDDGLPLSNGGGEDPAPPAGIPKQDIVEVEPHFSAEDLAAARQQGFDAGRQSGRDDARQLHQQKVAEVCERIAHFIEQDTDSSLQLTERSIEAVTQLLLGTIAALLPSVCNRHAAAEIATTVRNLVGGLSHETVISVSVAPSLQDALRTALMSLPPHTARRIVIVGVETMAEGDAGLEWAQGRASHSSQRARQAATEILTQLNLIDPERPREHQRSIGDWQNAASMPTENNKIGEAIDA